MDELYSSRNIRVVSVMYSNWGYYKNLDGKKRL